LGELQLFGAEITGVSERNRQNDSPEWVGPVAKRDAMDWCSARVQSGACDSQGIKSLNIHDAESAPSVHEDSGERFGPTISPDDKGQVLGFRILLG
jgi:hypothetical protein